MNQESDKLLVSIRAYDENKLGRDALFLLYKEHIGPYIGEAFGWDEEFQLARFRQHYPSAELFVVLVDREFAGYVAVKEDAARMHVSLIIVKPRFRSRGIGRRVMDGVHRAAADRHKSVTLSCFKRNVRALRFYSELGYRQYGADDVFADLRYEPA